MGKALTAAAVLVLILAVLGAYAYMGGSQHRGGKAAPGGATGAAAAGTAASYDDPSKEKVADQIIDEAIKEIKEEDPLYPPPRNQNK